MKYLFLVLLLSISRQSFASGCFHDEGIYSLDAIASENEASYCYAKPLTPIANPKSMAERQYNFFSSRLNEYIAVFSADALKNARLEYMFYRNQLNGLLSPADAREIDFQYIQKFVCDEKEVSKKIIASGTVGLTGVCLTNAQN